MQNFAKILNENQHNRGVKRKIQQYNGGINNAWDYIKTGQIRPASWLKNTSTLEINQDNSGYIRHASQ